MKKVYVGLMAIGAVVGPFAAMSMIHADDGKRVETVVRQTQDDDEAAWAAWRHDFRTMLEADEQYAAAEATLKAHEGDDKGVYAKLEAVAADRYREIARVVYEGHFEAREHYDAEFDELVTRQAAETPVQRKLAVCKAIQNRCEDDDNPDNMEWCILWFANCDSV